MVAACAMRTLGYRTLLIEKRGVDVERDDRRVIALSEGSRLVLERLGLWKAIGAVTPISRILVSEASRSDAVIIAASEAKVPALGFVIPFNELLRALSGALSGLGDVELCFGHDAEIVERDDSHIQLRLHGKAIIDRNAQLVLRAEGSATGDLSRQKTYRQHAIVAPLWTDVPANGCAYEHFTEQGPIALLPHQDHYALIWTVPSNELERWQEQQGTQAITHLQALLGDRVGTILALGVRTSFPLNAYSVRHVVEPRSVRLGNAAQQLHPVAAQGFNLGLRDVWTLFDCLWDSPVDPGAAALLDRYAARRRMDREGSLWLTDAMISTFGSAHTAVRIGRAGALRALAASSALRQLFAHRMMFGAI